MKPERQPGGVFRFLLVSLVVVCCTFFLIYICLPKIVQHHILPFITTGTGIENFHGEIRSISPYGMDIGPITIGADPDNGVRIDAALIDCTPSGLLRKTIDSIHISGLRVFSRFENGQLTVPGLFPFKETAQASTPESIEKRAPAGSDIHIRHVKISNARMVINAGDISYDIPFDLEIAPQKNKMNRMDIQLTTKPYGQQVKVNGHVDFDQNSCRLNIVSQKIHLGSLADLTSRFDNLTLSGKADMDISCDMNLSPFSLSSVAVDINSASFQMSHPNFEIASFSDGANAPSPLNVRIEKSKGGIWKASLSAMSMRSPFPVKISEFNSRIEAIDKSLTGSGAFSISIAEPPKFPDIDVVALSSIELTNQFEFSITNQGEWSFSVKGNEKKPADKKDRLRINNYIINTGHPFYHVTGSGFNSGGGTRFLFSFPRIKAVSDQMSLTIPKLTIKGEVPAGSADTLANLTCQLENASLTFESTHIQVPEIIYSGRAKKHPSKPFTVFGSITFSGASLAQPSSNVNINGINGRLPVSWPWDHVSRPGAFSVKDILLDKTKLGSVSGKWKQAYSGIVFDGNYETDLVPGFGLDFHGLSGFSDTSDFTAAIHFKRIPYKPPSPVDLGKLLPQANGLNIDGSFEVSGDILYDRFGIISRLTCLISDGVLSHPQQDLTIKGLRGGIAFTDLFQLKTAAKQRIEFAHADMGGINIQNGYVQFQMESPDSLLIEKSGFNWCNGHVESLSLRIMKDVADYDVTLFCDRLNLAMILEQFGAADADGLGTVNGRIPLRYRNGRLTFKNGFLFSTPGDGGTIRLRGTERLTAGIDPNSPQFTQIELARAALKNYDYRWAKLNLETQGEDLLLKLKFDGKPADPLPFIYKKEIGGFARVEAGGKGSVFEGIALDLNFRLPLDKILQYQDIFNMIK